MARARSRKANRVRAKRRLAKRKHRRKHPTTTAIVKANVTPPTQIVRHGRTQNLRPEEVALLKRTVAKGTSDDEFSLFMLICRKHKVDPFIGQIHCVMFPVTKHHKDEKGIWVAGDQMVIIMGINGYRSTAARSHKDYGGADEPTFTWFADKRKTPAGKLIPESATIKLWKKGLEHPIVSTVRWEEFAPVNLGTDRAKFWNTMPCHKLGLCAESHAIRKGYPDLSNIYTEEEMDQQLQDYSEGGRLIVESDGRAPSGAPTGAYGVNTWRDQQPAIDAAINNQTREEAIAALKAKGLWCEQHQCPISTNHLKECESSRKATETAQHTTTTTPKAGAEVPAGGGPVAASSPAGGFLGKIEVDWTDKASPIVRGDLTGDILESFKKNCKPTWGKDDWWHVTPDKAQVVREMCAAYNYEFVETFPAEKLPPNTQRGAGKLPAGKKKDSKPPAAATVIKGVIEKCNTGMTQRNAPTRQLKMGGFWYTSYVNPLFEYLDQHGGKECELFIDERKNIVGIKRIGARLFDTDGRTPIVNRDEPRGGNLFEK
jgi:phage recombination protein Bet